MAVRRPGFRKALFCVKHRFNGGLAADPLFESGASAAGGREAIRPEAAPEEAASTFCGDEAAMCANAPSADGMPPMLNDGGCIGQPDQPW